MADTGYSGTPLLKKLGIKPGMKILLMNAPENYPALLEADISGQYLAAGEIPDLIHLFARNNAVFLNKMQAVLKYCKKNTSTIVWVSWYKKTSGIVSDLSENMIRDFALQHGLVDVKVCAVSNEWSGLKLVVPLAER